MSHTRVEESLVEATGFLNQVVERRERLIKESRDVISLSSRTIVSVHNSDLRQARKFNAEARRLLSNLRKVAGSDLVRYLTAPEQEFVESSAMLWLKMNKEIPSRSSLNVLRSSYLLGLLDVIGEMKRSVYDSIRRGDMETAEQLFSNMESLFVLISPFAVYDNVVQGLRRKLDVARMLIEDTRATITEEARRLEFMDSMNALAKKLGRPANNDVHEIPVHVTSDRELLESKHYKGESSDDSDEN